MRKLSILMVAILFSIVCVASTNVATDRVIAFLVNAHTGRQMSADEWLTKNTRSAKAFVGFGGLDGMVRQSTARAARFGGFGSVQILDSKKDGNAYVVTAEVRFKEDHRTPENPATGASEDMVWRFRVINEGGKWMLDF